MPSLVGSEMCIRDRESSPLVILIVDNFPMTKCTIGNYTQTSFSGFSVEMIRSIMMEIGVTRKEFVFECVDLKTFTNRMDNFINVSMGESAQKLTSQLFEKGYQLSQPYYSSGLKAVIKSSNTKNMWSWIHPISMAAGFGLIISILLVGFSLWVFEEKNWGRPFSEHLHNLFDIMYDTFCSLFQTNSVMLKKSVSRSLQWVLWGVITVFIVLYQATLTGAVSVGYREVGFSTVAEGKSFGKRFAAYAGDKPVLQTLFADEQITYYPAESHTVAAEVMMKDLMDNNKIDAVIMDHPLLKYHASRFCNVKILDEWIFQYSYTSIFPKPVSQDFVKAYSHGVLNARDGMIVRLLERSYFELVSNTDCTEYNNTKMSFDEVAGLWIVLAAGVSISIILYILKKIRVFKSSEKYVSPYYFFNAAKSEIFERQLKESVEYEIGKILRTYEEQLMQEIEQYESTLLLQDEAEKVRHEQDDEERDGNRETDKLIPDGQRHDGSSPASQPHKEGNADGHHQFSLCLREKVFQALLSICSLLL
eukprot:TRINITY_DN2196_c0_g1_i6.p1 TRINITY_DN2196_c0_g1~~TRINITY_DN2196_c0_g1_i6.p1  ORF type:complete len:533 (+),score=92.22 TRINITY_DN2196_c0_g1_i6:76-1674(+)